MDETHCDKVKGVLTVTPRQVFFQPDMDDRIVLEQGLGATSVTLEMLNISTADITDISTERSQHVEDGYVLVSHHFLLLTFCSSFMATDITRVKELMIIEKNGDGFKTYCFQVDDAEYVDYHVSIILTIQYGKETEIADY